MRMILPGFIFAAGCLALPGAVDRTAEDLDGRRADVVRALGAETFFWGAPTGDREAWARVARDLPVAELGARAAEFAAEPTPELGDGVFLRFTRDGNRSEYQDNNRRRLHRLQVFAWAEALEGAGRWRESLEAELAAVLAERTWVLPAHDPRLDNFEGRAVEVDLMVAMKGWSIAQVLAWHGEWLAPELRAKGAVEVRRRLIDPFLRAMREEPLLPGMWWVRADNNWNPVCHAGVVGAALALPLGRELQAEIIAHTEGNLAYYLRGFTPDGYCSEGVGYWNYGFGHFAMLAETLSRATGGLVQPLAGEQARKVAAYPWRLNLLPGVFPAYADMHVGEQPSRWFGALAGRLLDPEPRGMRVSPMRIEELFAQQIYESAVRAFLPVMTAGAPPARAPNPPDERHWFGDAQVYAGRASPQFAASIKGGHNAEHHNHNDVGSFVVATGSRAVLVDPGLEVYTARTFGPGRYESAVINSYGHAVPRVAGQLQATGRERAARVLRTEFTAEADVVVLDLTAAYDVPDLVRLVRTFTLRRAPVPELVVEDEVEFTRAAAFETALITFDPWRRHRGGDLMIGDDEAGVRVEVVASGEWELKPETLNEDLPQGRKPVRLGLRLTAPVERARIITTVRPR